MTIHSHPHYYSHILSQRSSPSPSNSPSSVKRPSLSIDDDVPFAYDFPHYTYVPSPSPVAPLSAPSNDDALSSLASSSTSTSTGTGSDSKPVSTLATSSAASPSRNRGRSQDRDLLSGPSSQDAQPICSPSPTAPPPASARFFHNSSCSSSSSTAPIYYPSSSSSAFTSNACPVRARGPSFASTTSYTSASTATSSTSSASSSGAPATPPRTSHPLAYVSSPTTSRVLRPYWERSHPLGAPDEDGCRLDEEAEDQLREREKELRMDGPPVIADHDEEEVDDSTDEEYEYDARRNSSASGDLSKYTNYLSPASASTIIRKPHLQSGRPRSIRRSPFADDDPAQPYNYSHVYLDDDVQPMTARRFSGSASGSGSITTTTATPRRRKMTDSPRSVARSASLSHGQGRASPRRVNSPMMMNSLSGASSRPQSPALSIHSHLQSAAHSPAHSSSPLNVNASANSPSPAHTGLPLRDASHTPHTLGLPEPSPEVDASPLRTALLLNPDPDLSLARTHSGQSERRFSGGRGPGSGSGLGGGGGSGLGYGGGLGLHGMGGGAGALNASLARRRAEWTAFEGDEYSVSGYDARSSRPQKPLAEEEEDAVNLASRRSSRYGFGYGYGYGYGGSNLDVDDDDDDGGGDEEDEEEGRRANVDLSSPRPSFSSTSRPHPYARVSSPLASEKRSGVGVSVGVSDGGRRSSSQPRGGISYTYAYGFRGERSRSDSRDEDLISERPSSSQLSTRISAVGNPKSESESESKSKSKSDSNDDNDKEKVEGSAKGEGGGDGVPTCFAFKWGLRARWAALKLRVRLGAFRARRRVGLV
ncbi:hypothetical protein A7U60_g648 [Sanghuangporus baumii]|uniref:Uncharacterized protein n=1 Tax=Sanghuangporus baumii TaxID=108892 RepID=A0A9Q5I6C0_SANBA|nr:hypothetical protein A7U60_g648 [Sanghuangporus baumii]